MTAEARYHEQKGRLENTDGESAPTLFIGPGPTSPLTLPQSHSGRGRKTFCIHLGHPHHPNRVLAPRREDSRAASESGEDDGAGVLRGG